MRFTPDARRALGRSGLSRRSFLQHSGALIVGFAAVDLAGEFGLCSHHALAQGARAGGGQLDAWLAVAADGTVTAYTGKCELGQGLQTAQVQLVAEELDVAVARIRLVQCDTDLTPDQGTTSGSQSHPANFNRANLAQAAATARAALVGLASARLDVPAGELATTDGVVASTRDASKRATYAELVGGRRFMLPIDQAVARKPPAAWKVLGTSVPRVDLPALATGTLEFVQNVRVPGMLHGAVVRPPNVGATLASVDERSVADLAGLVRVVVKKNFVGVVADKPWQALKAAAKLQVQWTSGDALPEQASYYDSLRSQAARDALVVDSGDMMVRMRDALAVLRATYVHPFQMHGSVGTSCAVADVRNDRATIWSSTQAAHALRSTAAIILGLPPEQVRVVFTRGSGCYGINGADTVSYDAAILSQAVERPVRVQLSRKDEMAWENYGLAAVIDQAAALDGSGNILAWDHESWSVTRGGRPGANVPGNVVTGMLLGYPPAPFAPRSPAPAPTTFNNGSNAAPSYVQGCAGGRCGGTGTIRSERVLTHTIVSPFFTGPLRSPSRLQNTFAHESFMDELAAGVEADPIEYRLRHLSDPRLIEVVEAVRKASGWQTRPSPVAQTVSGRARGRGVACVLYEGDNGYCAMVAEVEVELETGVIAVTRLVTAQDCGPISTPDGMKNQIEGGALQGLSRALGEEVRWDGREVTSTDWRTYRTLTLSADLPVIESVLINRHDVPAMGAGETTITLVAAAVGNAIFDATGARLREVPFTPDKVKAALEARATPL
jgi:CO/xanthine dehydrogenase Mo-binding subunit